MSYIWIKPQAQVQVQNHSQNTKKHSNPSSPLFSLPIKSFFCEVEMSTKRTQTWKYNTKCSLFVFLFVTRTFQQGIYLQASEGLWEGEHLIPNRTPLLILNGMEIQAILNNASAGLCCNSGWNRKQSFDKRDNTNNSEMTAERKDLIDLKSVHITVHVILSFQFKMHEFN